MQTLWVANFFAAFALARPVLLAQVSIPSSPFTVNGAEYFVGSVQQFQTLPVTERNPILNALAVKIQEYLGTARTTNNWNIRKPEAQPAPGPASTVYGFGAKPFEGGGRRD